MRSSPRMTHSSGRPVMAASSRTTRWDNWPVTGSLRSRSNFSIAAWVSRIDNAGRIDLAIAEFGQRPLHRDDPLRRREHFADRIGPRRRRRRRAMRPRAPACRDCDRRARDARAAMPRSARRSGLQSGRLLEIADRGVGLRDHSGRRPRRHRSRGATSSRWMSAMIRHSARGRAAPPAARPWRLGFRRRSLRCRARPDAVAAGRRSCVDAGEHAQPGRSGWRSRTARGTTPLLTIGAGCGPGCSNSALIRITIAATRHHGADRVAMAPAQQPQQARTTPVARHRRRRLRRRDHAGRCYALIFTRLSGVASETRAAPARRQRMRLAALARRLAIERQADGDTGAPRPAWLAISIWPPCSATSPFTIERPSPVPS